MKDSALADAVIKLSGRDVYVFTEPEVLDFTNPSKSKKLIISGEGGTRVELPLPQDLKFLVELLGVLECVFDDPNKVVIGWNIKSFLSYVIGITGKNFDFVGKVIDLKITERFFGNDTSESPKNFREARTRLAQAASNPMWGKFKEVYRQVYQPLITSVIPRLETTPVADSEKKIHLFPCYEIAGQANGRMLCEKNYTKGYIPHSLGKEDKKRLSSIFYGARYIYLDFRHMEASVLAWLTNDSNLHRAIESDEDIYSYVWREITTLEPNEHFREKCKSIFLPIVFGMGKKSVASKINVSEDTANKIIDKIYNKFHIAFDWIKRNQQSEGDDGIVYDYFGRGRKFYEATYKSRNFLIQSPSALICLHKLIKLMETVNKHGAKVLYQVHDGYMVVSDAIRWGTVAFEAKKTLEATDDLYPGLKLKVSCKVGSNLWDMNQWPAAT